MSKKNSKITKPEMETVTETSMEETVAVINVKETDVGVVPTEIPLSIATVINCNKLNVRKKPDIKAPIVKVVNVGTQFGVGDLSTDTWVEVIKNGKSIGYCMRKYIKIS